MFKSCKLSYVGKILVFSTKLGEKDFIKSWPGRAESKKQREEVFAKHLRVLTCYQAVLR